MGHSVPGSVGQIPLKKAGGPDLGHMSFPEAITTVNRGGAIQLIGPVRHEALKSNTHPCLVPDFKGDVSGLSL